VKGFFMRSLSPLAALFAIALVVLGAPSLGRATVIAFTNFDEPALGANTYSPGTTGEELGFWMISSPAPDPVVVNDNDHTDASTDLGKADQGQSYYFTRPSGNKLRFDDVDLAAYDDVIVSVWIRVPDVSFGTGDGFTISVIYNTLNTVTLAQVLGDSNLSPFKATWGQVTSSAGAVPDSATTAYMKIETHMSQATEDFWVDDVLFTPEPATLALMGFGMAGILWVSRRRSGKRSP
jgi:hypothetical protein